MAAQLDLKRFPPIRPGPGRRLSDQFWIGPGVAIGRPWPAWWAGRMYLTLGALSLLWIAGYLVSVRRHPYRPCRRCKGAGKHFGAVFSFAHRPCRWCGGFGRRTRFGARILSRG